MKVFKAFLRPLYDYAVHLHKPTKADWAGILTFEKSALAIPYKSQKTKDRYRSLLGVELTRTRRQVLAYKVRGRLMELVKAREGTPDMGDATLRRTELLEIANYHPDFIDADPLISHGGF